MSYVSVGDMAHQFLLRQHSTKLKTDLNRLALELSSGVVGDVAKTVAGDFTPLAGIELSLANLETYKTSTNEAASFTQAAQDSLGLLQDLSESLSSALLTAGNSGHATLITTTATDSRQKFRAAVSALNTQVAGRSLLSGTATDKPAMASPQVILASLQTAIAGQTTAAGIQSAVNAWFDTPGGGYDTVAYLGSSDSLSPFQIGPGQQASMNATASDQAIRDNLKGFAMAALVAEGALAGDVEEQRKLLLSAGEGLLSSQQGVGELRAAVGSAQGLIENAATQNQAESASLNIARNNIVSADPYKTASDLESVQSSLEMLYTLTARISRLSLVNFLK